MSESLTSADALATLRKLIGDMTFTMFTTQNSAGELSSRPMTTQKLREGDTTLSFTTAADQPLVADVRGNSAVMLTYMDLGKHDYVVVKGEATITRDPVRAKEYWSTFYEVWFEGPDDPRLMIVDVTPHFAEYWDSPSKPRLAYDFLQGIIIGIMPDHTEHRTLRL